MRICKLALVMAGWCSLALAGRADSAAADEAYLKSAKVPTDPPGLAHFLRKQILTDQDRKEIAVLIDRLGDSNTTDQRESAEKLITKGLPALSQLKQSRLRSSGGQSLRIDQCVTAIEKNANAAAVAAAVRLVAQRPTPDTDLLLLDLFPSAGEKWIEREVLNSLCRLAIASPETKKTLLDAAKASQPNRRAAAGHVLAKAGNAELRSIVRPLLDDRDAVVRDFTARGLLCNQSHTSDTAAEDRKFLSSKGIGTDSSGLIAFLRKRTLYANDLDRCRQLIGKLGSSQFQERENATRQLITAGASILPLLRDAAKSKDLEVVRRVERCMEEITRSPGPALPAAAVRLLSQRPSSEAVRALLEFLPFADDTFVEEEVLASMEVLSVRQSKVDDVLVAALKDKQPKRRAAAAMVLGRVGLGEHCRLVVPLLKDDDPYVRLRAAQGLLAAKDKSAVPVLIALLDQAPASQAEMLLYQVAGADAPDAADDKSGPDQEKAGLVWQGWWRQNQDNVDLRVLGLGERYLGLTIVAELIGTNAKGNRVWEFGRDGKKRWEMNNLRGPIDAQFLRGGRVLVAEHQASQVTERDRKGNVLWTHKVPGNPVACQRLPNGNTFVATYRSVLEVTPAGRELYRHNPNAKGGIIYDACKLPNGRIACISGRGVILEMDTTGKRLRTINVGARGGWAGVSPLPGGRFLVALMSQGKVKEIDGNGKVHWECTIPQACHAIRLPTGNTLVACMNTQRVVEVNRSGKVVREQKTRGRPFHVRSR